MSLMRNALLWCSGKLNKNVVRRVHEEGFALRTFEGIWPNRPPQSGALAHMIAYGREIIPKKIDTQKSVPLCGVCVA